MSLDPLADDPGQGAASEERPVMPLDAEALLVALVLVPASYSRNRFFELYRHPEARRVRRRAALLRSLVSDVLERIDSVQIATYGAGYELRIALDDCGSVRRTRLSERELALVALAFRRAAPLPARAAWLARIIALVGEPALAELARMLPRLLEAQSQSPDP